MHTCTKQCIHVKTENGISTRGTLPYRIFQNTSSVYLTMLIVYLYSRNDNCTAAKPFEFIAPQSNKSLLDSSVLK